MRNLYISYIILSLVVGVVVTVSAHGNFFNVATVYSDLEVSEPSLLPDSPLYFLKNIGRGIRLFFTFDPVKKTELELKFVDEKFSEVAKAVDSKPDSLDKALQNYLDAHERLREKLGSLKDKNKNADTLLFKLENRVKRHLELFDELKDEFTGEEIEKSKKEIEETSKKSAELKAGRTGGVEKRIEKEEKKRESPEIQASIENFSFGEQEIKIPVGSSVTWTNKDTAAHTITSNAGKFESKLLQKGETYSRTFAERGVFPYHCAPHPNMKGKVIVE